MHVWELGTIHNLLQALAVLLHRRIEQEEAHLAVRVAVFPFQASRRVLQSCLAQIVDSLGKRAPGHRREYDCEYGAPLLVVLPRVWNIKVDNQLQRHTTGEHERQLTQMDLQ